MNFVRAALAMVGTALCVISSAGVSAAATHGTPPLNAPPSYTRFCSGYQSLSESQYLVAQKKDSFTVDLVPDADVLTTVKAQLPATATVSIAIRQYDRLNNDSSGHKTVVVHVQDSGKTYYLVAAFDSTGHFVGTTPIDNTAVTRVYRFARAMVPYMLLNDLLASDAVVPRLGCVRAAEIQIASVEGALPELETALMTPPAQDAVTLAQALVANRTFSTSKEALGNPLTVATLAQLGKTPSIALVYRDAGADVDEQQVYIVKLSHGSIRTYAAMTVEHGTAELGAPALCAVGDNRCAAYYLWP